MENCSLFAELIFFAPVGGISLWEDVIMFLIELKVVSISIADAVSLVRAIGLPNIWTRSPKTQNLVCFLLRSIFSLVTELQNSRNKFI